MYMKMIQFAFQSLSDSTSITFSPPSPCQVLMVRFCTLFNAQERTVTFLNGQTYPLASLRALGMESLLDAMFEFSEKLRLRWQKDETRDKHSR